LCFADGISAELVAAGVGARMFARWRAELYRRGFDASDEHGLDVRKVHVAGGDLADYFTKIAHEVTGSHRKEGTRRGGRTPMQLLADAVETYRVEDLERHWAWERVSDGRRQLAWSRGSRDLRKLAKLGQEASGPVNGPDAYAVVGALAELVHRLPQLLDYLGRGLRRARPAENYADCGHDPAVALRHADAHLTATLGALTAARTSSCDALTCGSGGIRTPGTLRYVRFQGGCNRPLCHASAGQGRGRSAGAVRGGACPPGARRRRR